MTVWHVYIKDLPFKRVYYLGYVQELLATCDDCLVKTIELKGGN